MWSSTHPRRSRRGAAASRNCGAVRAVARGRNRRSRRSAADWRTPRRPAAASAKRLSRSRTVPCSACRSESRGENSIARSTSPSASVRRDREVSDLAMPIACARDRRRSTAPAAACSTVGFIEEPRGPQRIARKRQRLGVGIARRNDRCRSACQRELSDAQCREHRAFPCAECNGSRRLAIRRLNERRERVRILAVLVKARRVLELSVKSVVDCADSNATAEMQERQPRGRTAAPIICDRDLRCCGAIVVASWFLEALEQELAPFHDPSSRGTARGTCGRRCRRVGSPGGCWGRAGSGPPAGSSGTRSRSKSRFCPASGTRRDPSPMCPTRAAGCGRNGDAGAMLAVSALIEITSPPVSTTK